MSIEYDEDAVIVVASEAYVGMRMDGYDYNAARVSAIVSIACHLCDDLKFYGMQIGAQKLAEQIFEENKEWITGEVKTEK